MSDHCIAIFIGLVASVFIVAHAAYADDNCTDSLMQHELTDRDYHWNDNDLVPIYNIESFWNGFSDFLLLYNDNINIAFSVYCSALHINKVPLLKMNLVDKDADVLRWFPTSLIRFRPSITIDDYSAWFQFNECDNWDAYSGDYFQYIELSGERLMNSSRIDIKEALGFSMISYFNAEQRRLVNASSSEFIRLNYSDKVVQYNKAEISNLPIEFDRILGVGAFNFIETQFDFHSLSLGPGRMYSSIHSKAPGCVRFNAVVVSRRMLVSGLWENNVIRNSELPDCLQIWLFSGRTPVIIDLESLAIVVDPGVQ